MRTLAFLSAAFVALLTALPASASSIIYDNGAPSQIRGYNSDADLDFTISADDFVLQTTGPMVITDAHWWGGCNPSPCSSDQEFTLFFYENSSAFDQPGSVIQSFTVGTANQTATGNEFDETTEYAYSAIFAPLTLAANTRYWFGVQNSSGAGTWRWEITGPEIGGGHDSLQGSSGVWFQFQADLAFNLTGEPVEAPEPGSLLLLGCGAFGLLARRWRRTHS